MTMAVYCICLVVFIMWCKFIFNNNRRKKELFNVSDILKLETVILFSNYELVNYIMKIMRKSSKNLKIQCSPHNYIYAELDLKPKELRKRIETFQKTMINETDEIQDYSRKGITELIYSIWIQYGMKRNYRTILVRELKFLLENAYISQNMYIEAYKRIYMFENISVKENQND